MATGRSGLSESSAVTSPAAVAHLADWEGVVAAAWETALRRRPIDRDADFRDLHMNSNRAMQVIAEIWFATSVELPVNVFFEAPTIRRMAAAIHDGSALAAPDLVLLRGGDGSDPLFLFPGGAGNLTELTDLVRALDHSGPIYGIAFSGLDGVSPLYDRIEIEALRSVDIIRRAQPSGPVQLVGYSIGGVTALETARLLRARGKAVFLGLIDTPQNDHLWPYSVWLAVLLHKSATRCANRLRRLSRLLAARRAWGKSKPDRRLPERRPVGPPRRGSQFTFRFRNPHGPNYPYYSPYWAPNHTPNYTRVGENACRMKGFYKPSLYDGPVSFFVSLGGDILTCDPSRVWRKYLPAAEWISVPGNHLSILIGRHAARLADEISVRLKPEAPAAQGSVVLDGAAS
jgi:thioesterase domain-containing protein